MRSGELYRIKNGESPHLFGGGAYGSLNDKEGTIVKLLEYIPKLNVWRITTTTDDFSWQYAHGSQLEPIKTALDYILESL